MNTPFARKVAYGAAIAVLLYPLFMLGQPAGGSTESRGGMLAQLREKHNLAQVSLGEIDPASESLRLATLGMRGVAANMMWLNAMKFKKMENWEALSATLNQITKLQPNFLEVWEFQAHNLSYNVSVEFDDYRHRYHWVKKGIDFLTKGVNYNRDEPKLLHTLGKFTGHKLGNADEKELFRELYRKDADWHNVLAAEIPEVQGPEVLGPKGLFPDNWLTGRLWYLRAERAIDNSNKILRGNSPLVFHADRPKSRINYAQAIQSEGYFEQAMNAWRRGGEEWTDEYGARTIPSSWGVNFQLREMEQVAREALEARDEMEKLVPNLRKELTQEKIDALPEFEREVYLAKEEDRVKWTGKEWDAYLLAESKIAFTDVELSARAPENVRAKVRRLAERIDERRLLASRIQRYRNIVNYNYWKLRAEAEQTKLTADARTYLHSAEEKLEEADLEGAQSDYEKAWDLWEEIFEKWPALKSKDSLADLEPALRSYRRVLNHQNKPDIPADFKLAWLLDEAELAALEARQKVVDQQNALRGGSDKDPNNEPGNEPNNEPGKEPAPEEPKPPATSDNPTTDSNEAPQPPLEEPSKETKDPAKAPVSDQLLPPLEVAQPAETDTSLFYGPLPTLGLVLFGMVQAPPVAEKLLPPVEQADKPKPDVKPAPKPEVKPAPKPEVKPAPKPEVKPAPKPEVKPAPKPEVKPTPKPEVEPAPKPVVKPEVKPAPKPEVKPATKPEVKPATKPEVKPAAKPEVNPAPQPEVKPLSEPELKSEPSDAGKGAGQGEAGGAGGSPSDLDPSQFQFSQPPMPVAPLDPATPLNPDVLNPDALNPPSGMEMPNPAWASQDAVGVSNPSCCAAPCPPVTCRPTCVKTCAKPKRRLLFRRRCRCK